MHRSRNLQGQRVAIYARFSSERQRETSIDDQVRRCRDYIAQAGGDPDTAIVFSDYAISGASLDRPGFESLMAAVDDKRIDTIVTEDISRISRDFADSAMVFKRLQFAQIPLIGIADGIDTSTRDAKLSFTLKSLVAELYLDDLRDKTLRGLEGRARAGYATGNTPYGYRTKPDRGKTGRIVGHRILIHDDQAAIVRRIFEMYRDGKSLAAIARTLNADGIPSPRAGTRHKRTSWGPSTIRSMLYNERYVGIWTYKQTQWVKVPGSNKRRPRRRSASEMIREERPALRVIDADLWNRVQTRLGATHQKYTHSKKCNLKGRTHRSNSSPYLFSGLLICGQCRAHMTIVTGSSAAYYRCSGQRKKGACTNKLSIREDLIKKRILARLCEALMTPEIIDYVQKRVRARLSEQVPLQRVELARHRQQLTRIECRIQRLIDFIGDGDCSEYIATSLRDLEARAKTEKAAISQLRPAAGHLRDPHKVSQITQTVFDLEALLQQSIAESRRQLGTLLTDEAIRLLPSNGSYAAHTMILPAIDLR